MPESQTHNSIEDALNEARRVMSLVDDMSTAFAAASPDTVELRAESH